MINEIKFKRDTAFRQDMFTPESFAHPAKMDSQLFIWIVEKFTQLGDTILDPMAGSGTALLACMMGRNVILVELEEKFCDMMTGYDCSGKVIKSEVIHHEGIEAGWWCKSGSYEGSIRWDTKEAAIEFLKTDGYTEGEIDECELYYDPTVTPPHDEIKIITQCGKNKEHKAHHVLGNWELIKQKPQLGCQMGEATIIHGDSRNLKGLLCDKIITSPPFVGITAWQDADFQKKVSEKYGQRNWSSNGQGQDNPSNIANLKYGDIDKIITSPPYANQAIGDKGGGIDWDKSNKPITEGRIGSLCKEYSDNPSNIGNLPYGKIDTVITSPPYEESLDRWAGDKQNNLMIDKGLHAMPKVDKIITSPPYEEAMGDKHHSPRADKLADEKSNPTTYTDKVDCVLTSPPYELTAHGSIEEKISAGFQSTEAIAKIKSNCRQYSASEQNIGNLKSQSYLDAMKIVYSECFKVLKPGGLMILVTKNFIRNQKEIRLDLDTIKLCEQSGFTFLDRWYRKLHAQSFWRIIYKKKFPDAPSLDFEDVLVFKK